MELWDIYTKDRVKTNKTHERGKPLQIAEYHLVVHIWIINKKGEFLIQKRQPWKSYYPNMWDCAAAGSAIVGDDSQTAAIREVKEELGIDLDIKNSELLLTVSYDSGFDDIWVTYQDILLEDLTLQYEEVADAKWVTRHDMLQMIKDGVFIDNSYLDTLFESIDKKLK